MTNRLYIEQFSDNRKFLSGLTGRLIYSKLIAAIEKQREPSPLFLDFSGITVSGSFYSQAVFPLRNFARRMGAYLVLCNLNADSFDELTWLLEMATDATYVCDLDQNNQILNLRWIGNLDAKQRLTFEAVLVQQESDASKLALSFPNENIKITGWNNRLVALHKKGLIMEIRHGRSKTYRPVLQIQF